MNHYQLIQMSFDGDYTNDHCNFDTIEDAWRYSQDQGSRWYFYPFHFVVKDKTIKDAPYPLNWAVNKRIKTVSKLFYQASLKPENLGMGPDEFSFEV
jgi:hypothetical protein